MMSVPSSVSVGPLTRSASARVTDAKKGVQKGFLKHARSSQPKIASEMNVEAKDYFAFIGFPVNSDPYEMCNLIKELCHDHLDEFDLRVLGWAQFVEHDEPVRAVGLEFLASQREALDNKIFELRDVWWSHKCQLSSVIVVNPQVFIMPSPSVRAPAKKSDVSPLLNSPHRRLVEKVFESARSNPSPAITALAQVPALPGDDQNAKLEQVLHSLD